MKRRTLLALAGAAAGTEAAPPKAVLPPKGPGPRWRTGLPAGLLPLD